MQLPQPLLARLNRLDDEIPSLNHGGCAYAAYGIYNYIQRNHPELSPRIIYIVDHEDYKDLQLGNPISCSHAVVEINGIYYDSEGIYTPDEDEHAFPISKEFLKETLIHGDWNDMFNISNVKHINKILNTRIPYKAIQRQRNYI